MSAVFDNPQRLPTPPPGEPVTRRLGNTSFSTTTERCSLKVCNDFQNKTIEIQMLNKSYDRIGEPDTLGYLDESKQTGSLRDKSGHFHRIKFGWEGIPGYTVKLYCNAGEPIKTVLSERLSEIADATLEKCWIGALGNGEFHFWVEQVEDNE